MSETPDDAPSISGPAPPNTWTLGYAEEAPGGMKCVAERSLSDGEYERYHEAVSFVLDRKDQASLKLVIGNYGEFRAIQSSMAIIFTTTKQANWPDPQDSLFHLCRILLNWLNSIRLFDDHNRARIVRTYGDPSPELDAFMAARATIYDEVPGYRFMFEMRNYAQHCGVVPVQAQIHQNASGNTLDLHFDRDQLLRDFGKWKRVKPDLEAGPEHIAIDSPIEEAMEAVTRLAQAVATIDQPRFSTSIETVKEIMGPPLDDPNRRKTIFKMTPPSTDASGAQQMKMQFAPAMEVQPGPADAEPASVDVPDFTSHRPTLTTKKSTRECQGPLNKVTHLPAESCTERATTAFFFPHQEGVAFLFGCDEHALALGQWAGKKFGGCFGGEAEKAEVTMKMASTTFARIDEPHGAEYDKLIPVPGAPKVQFPFAQPDATDAPDPG
jgi:hypothetical protein